MIHALRGSASGKILDQGGSLARATDGGSQDLFTRMGYDQQRQVVAAWGDNIWLSKVASSQGDALRA